MSRQPTLILTGDQTWMLLPSHFVSHSFCLWSDILDIYTIYVLCHDKQSHQVAYKSNANCARDELKCVTFFMISCRHCSLASDYFSPNMIITNKIHANIVSA